MFRKPTLRDRYGEILEGLPGSKSVACEDRAVRNSGEPADSRRANYGHQAGRAAQRQEARPDGKPAVGSVHSNQSSPPRAAATGEGADTMTPPAKETGAVRTTEPLWQTSLRAITSKATKNPRHRFGGLYRLLNETMLKDCFQRLRKDAAPGVDEVTYEAYAKNLDANVADLVQRLKRKSYHARLVRRKLIPKGGGKLRPLGITTLEEKLLQTAVALILSAIYEADFLPCSYGYRPGRGPHDAVTALTDTLFRGHFEFVVEADIRGYFEHIQHDWLVQMLELRIDDAALVGLIRKWLRAGILLEDGRIEHPETGTPQGGSVSPVLANVYLHYVLDLWFERRVKKSNRGSCALFRFADDFVVAFAYRHEAEAFERVLKERLEKFGLEVAPDKTKTLRFGRGGGGHNARFDFLGFEFRWENSRAGKPMVKRRTARKKLREAVANFTAWIKTHRHRKLRELMKTAAAKHRGHWNYYGLIGNYDSLSQFRTLTCEILFKWLNRRSQRRSLTWRAFNRLLERHQVPRPRIREQQATASRGAGSPGGPSSGGDWAQFLQEMWRTARA